MDNNLKKILKEQNLGIKLDIGCGQAKQQGFVGLDIRKLPGVDIVQDIEKFPWVLPNESVSFAVASHLVEHVNPAHGIFLKFMDEVWRIMKPECQFLMSMPYAGSRGYWQDPTHVNGCNEATWCYFDPLDKSGLYTIYRPFPWKIVRVTYDITGNMEVCLEKRRIDKSYNVLSK
jgi:SAM-dependent methyltransferase